MVGPLAGPEARALALALRPRARRDGLPPKFGWLVDGGGPLSIVGERADIALCVTRRGRCACASTANGWASPTPIVPWPLRFGGQGPLWRR